ncbi:MAG: hypothetical protein IH857_08290 [Deltaproteobacteria bacterium]|nr:hypothetical protein [Deltaproteobacteria bacterium]
MVRHQFLKGNKFSPGGKKGNKGGRPSKAKLEALKLAADMVKKYVEDRLKPIVDAYISAATGQRCGNSRRRFDNATNRHAIERFLGPAPRTLTLDLQDTVESFFEHVMEEDTHEDRDEEKS